MLCSLVSPQKVSTISNYSKAYPRVVDTGATVWEHVTPVLKLLHWPLRRIRIDFKVILLHFESINGFRLSNLSALLWPYQLLQTCVLAFYLHQQSQQRHRGSRHSVTMDSDYKTACRRAEIAETVDAFKRGVWLIFLVELDMPDMLKPILIHFMSNSFFLQFDLFFICIL